MAIDEQLKLMNQIHNMTKSSQLPYKTKYSQNELINLSYSNRLSSTRFCDVFNDFLYYLMIEKDNLNQSLYLRTDYANLNKAFVDFIKNQCDINYFVWIGLKAEFYTQFEFYKNSLFICIDTRELFSTINTDNPIKISSIDTHSVSKEIFDRFSKPIGCVEAVDSKNFVIQFDEYLEKFAFFKSTGDSTSFNNLVNNFKEFMFHNVYGCMCCDMYIIVTQKEFDDNYSNKHKSSIPYGYLYIIVDTKTIYYDSYNGSRFVINSYAPVDQKSISELIKGNNQYGRLYSHKVEIVDRGDSNPMGLYNVSAGSGGNGSNSSTNMHESYIYSNNTLYTEVIHGKRKKDDKWSWDRRVEYIRGIQKIYSFENDDRFIHLIDKTIRGYRGYDIPLAIIHLDKKLRDDIINEADYIVNYFECGRDDESDVICFDPDELRYIFIVNTTKRNTKLIALKYDALKFAKYGYLSNRLIRNGCEQCVNKDAHDFFSSGTVTSRSQMDEFGRISVQYETKFRTYYITFDLKDNWDHKLVMEINNWCYNWKFLNHIKEFLEYI